MKTNTLIALTISSSLVIPTAAQATIIQILEDDLYMYTQVYSTGTAPVEDSYKGSAFTQHIPGAPQVPIVSSSGDIPCQDPAGAVDHQWARATTDSDIDNNHEYHYVYIEAASGWNHQTCNTAYPWGNESTIELDLKFNVIPEGENNVFVYIEHYDSSFSLFDHTLGEEIAPSSSGSPYFPLLDNHAYTLSAGVARVATQDSLPYAYNDTLEAPLYYPYFNAIIVNTSLTPVPEPSALILVGLGLSGLLLTTLRTSRGDYPSH